MVVPALYIWFVADTHHPHFPLLGGWVGWLAALSGLPFLPTFTTFLLGLVVGTGTPLLVYLVRERLRLDDPSGIITASLWGGFSGIVAVGVLADGRYGAGWHGIGQDTYLGVARQGVSGWFVAHGMVADWPGQMWAQLVGGATYFIWAFLVMSSVGIVLALLGGAYSRLLSKAPFGEYASSVDQPAEAPVPEEGENN